MWKSGSRCPCIQSAGVAFRSCLASFLGCLGYRSYLLDLDVWLKPEVNGEEYYEYLFVHTDDILAIGSKDSSFSQQTNTVLATQDGSS
jgi:hypothetical protein